MASTENEIQNHFWHISQLNWHLSQYKKIKALKGYRCSECRWHNSQRKWHRSKILIANVISLTLIKFQNQIAENIILNNSLLTQYIDRMKIED